jgi:hypothetical protein
MLNLISYQSSNSAIELSTEELDLVNGGSNVTSFNQTSNLTSPHIPDYPPGYNPGGKPTARIIPYDPTA